MIAVSRARPCRARSRSVPRLVLDSDQARRGLQDGPQLRAAVLRAGPPRHRDPSDTLFTKTRPLTTPRSTLRSPRPRRRPAPRRRRTGPPQVQREVIPWSPAGMQANGRSCSAAIPATMACVPSPPAAASASAPSATAFCTSSTVDAVGEFDRFDPPASGFLCEVHLQSLAAPDIGFQ